MKFVSVKLRDLVYGAEFVTTLTRRRGVVTGTGWYPWDDGAGRTTRLRSVVVRYADGSERIHRAEMLVLVEANTVHARFTPAEDARRWSERLQDPETIATLADLARRARRPKRIPC